MSQISLTASMRSNLLSLQNTSKLMSQTQERLATGKKVNSAIDNPSSYYTAQSLNNRANDLSGLLDSMGQAISTIKAADEGISSITSFVEQAKAVATSALDTTDRAARTDYAKQFDVIMDQINSLAKDAGYKGVNLLKGDSLTVTFNEGRDSQLTIAGVDATYSGLEMDKAGTDWTAVVETPDGAITISNGKVTTTGGLVKDNIYTYDGEAYYAVETIEINTDMDWSKMAKIEKVVEGELIKYYDTYTTTKNITAAIEDATDAIETLRGYASTFGNNYSIVQTREEFTTNLINVLEEGADKLTLADMNEESANMLALQTRQQLAINSLSLASQAAQSVLKLF